MFIASRAERTSIVTLTFIQAPKNIITAMATMPTGRTLILISHGFNLVPGRELYGVASGYFPDMAKFRFSERDTQPQLGQLLRLAQRSNVVVDSLDSRGVYTPASNNFGDASNEGMATGSTPRP